MANALLSRLIGGPIRQSIRRARDRFLDATCDCEGQQSEVLRGLLQLNAGTRFARDHGLAPTLSVEQFRHRVPVTDYAYHQPYIERVKAGDHTALLGRTNKLLMFSLTSGTTSASKFIPITQRFLEDYRRGWKFWGVTAVDQHPQLYRRSFFQLAGNHDQFRTDAGVPCGNISGLVTAMQKRHVRALYAVPAAISRIEDPDGRRYAMLRTGLQDENVGQIITANPATLLHLAKFANANADRLVADIHNGTLSRAFPVPTEIAVSLRQRLKAKPRRAKQLEKAIDAADGILRPGDVWPHLEYLGVWTGGSAGAFASPLADWYGNIPFRDHGLHASEGRMTIPLRANTSSGVLDIASHFFEFIPETQEDATHPTVLLPHELQVNENYFILLTTASGLYRYNIRDVVRCTGFCNGTPELAFQHKGSHISSITGEKISESQVIVAVREAASQLGLTLSAFTLTPHWTATARYRLFVSADDVPAELLHRVAAGTDLRLQTGNTEYADKRGSSRLAPIDCIAISSENWETFRLNRIQAAGTTPEQYKHPCLLPDPQFTGLFEKLAEIQSKPALRTSA